MLTVDLLLLNNSLICIANDDEAQLNVSLHGTNKYFSFLRSGKPQEYYNAVANMNFTLLRLEIHKGITSLWLGKHLICKVETFFLYN